MEGSPDHNSPLLSYNKIIRQDAGKRRFSLSKYDNFIFKSLSFFILYITILGL